MAALVAMMVVVPEPLYSRKSTVLFVLFAWSRVRARMKGREREKCVRRVKRIMIKDKKKKVVA